MANKIVQPYLNPVKFHALNPAVIPQYVSKHMDDHYFVDTIHQEEEDVRWCQEWLTVDAIRLQFLSNYAPITLKLKNEKGRLIYSNPLETRQQDEFNPGFYIRQSDLDLAAFDPGPYYLQLDCGTGPALSLVSEPFHIIEDGEGTVLIEYSHYKTRGGVIFESPFSPSIRVPARIKYKETASKDTIYEDQPLNETIVQSVQYRISSFILGGRRGVPPWVKDKVARIMGCSSTRYDGRYYTKNEGSNFEPTELDGYPMAGWSIELRDRYNRDGITYENDAQIIGTNNMIAVIDTKGFGMNETGGDFLEILDVN